MRRPTVCRRVSTVLATLALVAATALVGSTSTAVAGLGTSSTDKPTIVLVHGAWADASSWNDVGPRLRHDGYRTIAPDLELDSVAADVTQVRAVLDAIPGVKILVAHSYGGIVVSNAAAGRSDVLGLVFSAAFGHCCVRHSSRSRHQ